MVERVVDLRLRRQHAQLAARRPQLRIANQRARAKSGAVEHGAFGEARHIAPIVEVPDPQLTRHFTALVSGPRIAGVVLTGFGTKAFVSGADVNFLGRIGSAEEGFETTQSSKEPGNLIEQLGKPVICALNGMAQGGGNGLAMCCTARIARAGVPMLVARPEANLGIVPGAGGTQRLPGHPRGMRHAARRWATFGVPDVRLLLRDRGHTHRRAQLRGKGTAVEGGVPEPMMG